MSITETKEGSIIEVSVRPRSREFKIVAESGEISVFCTEEPIEGKVNKELIKELSRLFKKKVDLISGFTSKQKLLIIRGIGKTEVEAALFHRTA